MQYDMWKNNIAAMCTASRRISKSIILQYRSNRRGDQQCWQHCSNVQRWQRAVVAGGDRSGLSGRCTLGYSLGYCALQTRILRSGQLHTGILCSAVKLNLNFLYNTIFCTLGYTSQVYIKIHEDTHVHCRTHCPHWASCTFGYKLPS